MTAVGGEGVAIGAWGWTRSRRASCKKGCSGRVEGNFCGRWCCCLSECSGFSGEYEYGSGAQPWTELVVEGECTASRGARPWI